MSSSRKPTHDSNPDSDPDPDSDSDSDLSLCEEHFKQSSIDVGLIYLDAEYLSTQELRLYRMQMQSPFFPSKVGGKPAWLAHRNVPRSVDTVDADDDDVSSSSIELKCDSCQAQLLFLLQIYAPISGSDKFMDRVEDLEATFHRTLYLFLCSNPACNMRTFKVYVYINNILMAV